MGLFGLSILQNFFQYFLKKFTYFALNVCFRVLFLHHFICRLYYLWIVQSLS